MANTHFCKSLTRNLRGSIQGDLPTTGAYNYTQQESLLRVAHIYKHPLKCTDKHAILQTPHVCVLVSALEQAGQGWVIKRIRLCRGCKQCATHFPLCVHRSGKVSLFFFSCALLTPKGNLVQEPSLCCCPLTHPRTQSGGINSCYIYKSIPCLS